MKKKRGENFRGNIYKKGIYKCDRGVSSSRRLRVQGKKARPRRLNGRWKIMKGVSGDRVSTLLSTYCEF